MEPSLTDRFLSQATGWTAALVSVGFIVSILYDWGFLKALGRTFADTPTTITDHFRTGIVWFPTVIGMAFVAVASELQIRRVERGLTEEEIVQSAKNPEKLRRFRDSPYKLIARTAPLGVVTYLLIGDAVATSLPFCLFVVWLAFAEWCYSAPLIQLRRNKMVQILFTFVPAIGIIVFFSGYNRAIQAATNGIAPISITFNSEHRVEPGTLLRNFERGVLYLNSSDSMVFVQWGDIESLRYEKQFAPYPGLLCKWFGWCSAENRRKEI